MIDSAAAGPSASAAQRVRQALLSSKRLMADSRLRGEITWVLASRAADTILTFALIKLLTNTISKAQYGEFNLAQTAALLLANLALMPMNQAYQRYFHSAALNGLLGRATTAMLRWYAVVTLAAIPLGLALMPAAGWLGVSSLSVLGATCYFVGDRWRTMAGEMLDIQRQRRAYALLNTSFLIVQLLAVWTVVRAVSSSGGAALITIGAVAACFAMLGMRMVLPPLLRPAAGGASESALRPMIWTFGIPSALILTFQWVQTFADRYILNACVGTQTVGHYVAVSQICTAAYQLLAQVIQWLAIPIAYRRAADMKNPVQVWSADRVLLACLGGYLALGGAALLVIWAAGPWLVAVLTSADYSMSRLAIGMIAAGRFLMMFAFVLQIAFAIHQRMFASLGFRIAGALLTMLLSWLIIQWFAARDEAILGAALGGCAVSVIYACLILFGPAGVFWLLRDSRARARQALAAEPPSCELSR